MNILDIIENKYTAVTEVRNIFENFHETMFSKDENKIDLFIERYQEKLKSFCNGLKKILPPLNKQYLIQ